MSIEETVIERLECPTCRGTGIHYGNGQDCDTCRGIGAVHATIRPLVGVLTTALEPDERDRLGFAEGDLVTVGKGKKEWIIHSFFGGYEPGVPLVRLEPVLGFSATSVTVDRLRAVTP